MKKAFDQTVRDLKREVNKKVLKVPSIEQKVLDATSNEPWGPHGTLLADISQASKNYHEYQMIMAVIWKRINDTGKNWRHVYKALTVLEYLVANGSERVIDEIREHAYQIQTLSDFQYIDSSGRDQGNNVRRKSQSLVVLVNDKERIHEVREKAAANRDKYRNTSMGSMYRPGSHSNAGGYRGYDDDRYEGRYGSRDEDRNGYGREREWGNRDDDRYGRYGDSYGRDGDRYGRDYEDHYSRDGYRDDDYRGRSQSVDDNQYGSRSRSSDRDRDRGYDDDGQYSSRGSGARAEDQSQDGRHLERKFSEQNIGAPPSYEDAVGAARSPTHSEQGELPPASACKSSSPPASASPGQAATTFAPKPASASSPPAAQSPVAAERKGVDSFDEFDPRGSFSAVPTTSHNLGSAEADLLGSLSDSFSTNSLALVPSAPTASEADASVNPSSGQTFVAASASSVPNQIFDDPFGDGPFKAIPSADNFVAQPQNIPSTASYHPSSNQSSESMQLGGPEAVSLNSFGDAFSSTTFTNTHTGASSVQPSANMQCSQQELSTSNTEIDILADILPPTGLQPIVNSQAANPAPTGQPSQQVGFSPQNPRALSVTGFSSQPGSVAAAATNFSTQLVQPVGLTSLPVQSGQTQVQTNFQPQASQLVPQNFFAQMSQSAPLTGFPVQASQASQTGFPSQTSQPTPGGFPSQMVSSPQAGFHTQPAQQNAQLFGSYNPHMGSAGPVTPQMTSHVSSGPTGQDNSVNFLAQPGSAPLSPSQMNLPSPQVPQSIVPASTGSIPTAPQPAKDKFETKSTVWADTLSRGLVNLNISGPKINPLADIGIDFDAINRKEKRMEKPTTAPVISTITMGKAMGSGSGMGRAGAGALRPPPNQLVSPGIVMGMGVSGGPSMGMGGYGAVNQPMGMGMNMNPNMGMGMNIGQSPMQRPMGFPPGGYNSMLGAGNYSQQPYGGGYR